MKTTTHPSPAPILLTGFKPYDGMARNPTELLMARAPEALADIPGVSLRAIVLDTDYALSEQQLVQAMDDFQPRAVISFGLNRRIDAIHLERIAVNIDDAAIPDTAGVIRRGQIIAADGPVGYWSTLPLQASARALDDAGIPVQFSNHAGTYICNHIFYFGRHLIATRALPIRMGFIHAPPLPEMVGDQPGRTGMNLETLLQAARIILTTTVATIWAGE